MHAELHGKLSSEASDADRREDILTSTVFGMLFATEAWRVLLKWIGRARGRESAPKIGYAVGDEQSYWFWPQMDNAEPDLVIEMGAALLVIEAKYFSGKGGTQVADPAGFVHDQLAREWRACLPAADHRAYPERLRCALASSDTEVSLIYLVRRSRWARERQALEISLSHVPEARMFLLTWEDLDETLAAEPESRWVLELRSYLARRDLAAFRGFRSCFDHELNVTLSAWSLRLNGPRTSFDSCFSASTLESIRLLTLRTPSFDKESHG